MDVSILGEIESSFGEITYTQNVSAHDTVCARGGNLETVAANAYLDKEKKKPCQGYSAEASSALVFYFAAVPDKNNINNCKVAKTDEPDCDPPCQSFFKTLGDIEEVDNYHFGTNNKIRPLTNIVDYIAPKFENCFDKTYRYVQNS